MAWQDDVSEEITEWAIQQDDPVTASAAAVHLVALITRVTNEATRAQRVVLFRNIEPLFDKDDDDLHTSDVIAVSKMICAYMRWEY